MQSDRAIPKNKPDIIIRDREKRTCMLMDVAISGDRNVLKKAAEKILKCKDFTIEIERMWNVETKHTNNNRGSWNLLKILRKCLSNIKHEIKELPKIKNNHIGHCTHTAESTDVEVHNI
jgi:hypothetical protein